jgi:hypothetical protein
MEGRLSTHVLNGETEEEKHRKTPSVYVSLSLSRTRIFVHLSEAFWNVTRCESPTAGL